MSASQFGSLNTCPPATLLMSASTLTICRLFLVCDFTLLPSRSPRWQWGFILWANCLRWTRDLRRSLSGEWIQGLSGLLRKGNRMSWWCFGQDPMASQGRMCVLGLFPQYHPSSHLPSQISCLSVSGVPNEVLPATQASSFSCMCEQQYQHLPSYRSCETPHFHSPRSFPSFLSLGL